MKSLLLLLTVCCFLSASAQNDAGAYMGRINGHYETINKDFWDYLKQSSKGRSASKLEKRRGELLTTLRSARRSVAATGSFQGSTELRDATLQYLDLSVIVLNDDFSKIVNLEKIAEESLDDMEAYLTLKEQVNDKMDSAYQVLNDANELFASQHNIRLVDSNNRLDRKLNTAGAVTKYYNQVFLIYFKCAWHEANLLEAMNAGKVSEMEQYRQSLEAVTQEELTKLATVPDFRENGTLKQACKQMLEFYLGEAVKYMPDQIQFFLLSDRVETLGKSLEAKSPNARTKEEVDSYNKAVQDYNAAAAKFNETNAYLNKYRTSRMEAWQKAGEQFINTAF